MVVAGSKAILQPIFALRLIDGIRVLIIEAGISRFKVSENFE